MDVPIEVILEEERKRLEREKSEERPRIHLPIPDFCERRENPSEAEEDAIVISMI